MLIVNADDWGRDEANTDRTLACVRQGRVSSVSAMVFMKDSARAASIARAEQIDAGLHLNFTSAFSAPMVAPALRRDQARVSRFLRRAWFTPQLFHPLLTGAFTRLAVAQISEFERLYGKAPARLDGHHHMHLCANVMRTGLLPVGRILRRNFTFFADEKGLLNRWYRRLQDFGLARRYRIADAFFSLPPQEKRGELARIVALAVQKSVELEVHPGVEEEMHYLLGDAFGTLLSGVPLAHGYQLNAAKR